MTDRRPPQVAGKPGAGRGLPAPGLARRNGANGGQRGPCPGCPGEIA
jgi:hypothetical protein